MHLLYQKCTFGFALIGRLVFDRGSLSFVLFVLQILSLLPPNLQRNTNRTRRNYHICKFKALQILTQKGGGHTNLSFSGIAFHTSANFLLSSPNTAG